MYSILKIVALRTICHELPKYGKSYYSFLEEFDLNNPSNLYGTYSDVLQLLLNNDTLNIPPVGETPINEWIKKSSISNLVGFDSGLFYDMLAANSYAQQLNDLGKPLSDKQIANIKKYYKNKSFIEILLKKNEEIAKTDGISSHLKVNETPVVPVKELTNPEKNHPQGCLVDSIVARYKGKVVVIDFWATWCAPCIMAISESRELKAEMLNKDVVFVYITSRSSPKKLWESKIQGIGGEHYYLNRGEEWESITFSDKYGFSGIPTYMLFDADGNFREKKTSYPGNEEMRKKIERLLQ